MYKIGVTSYAFEHTSERFAKLRASGLEAVELSAGNSLKIGIKEFVRMARENDVLVWSCHLPYRPTIALLDPEVRKTVLPTLMPIIEECSDLGIDKFIIHPSLPLPADADRNEHKLCSMEMLNTLAEFAHSNGAVIAVEDMIRSCLGNSAEELLEIISVNDKLRVCFDVNHLLNNTHEEFLKLLHDKIVTVHISDYDFVQERHWLPGKGKINWPELYSLFKKYGYNGVWMHELGLSETKEEDGDGGPTFDDLYRIANEIFSGKSPSYK